MQSVEALRVSFGQRATGREEDKRGGSIGPDAMRLAIKVPKGQPAQFRTDRNRGIFAAMFEQSLAGIDVRCAAVGVVRPARIIRALTMRIRRFL